MLLLLLIFSLQSFAQNSIEEMEQSFFLQEKAVPGLKPSAYKHFQLAKKEKTKLSIIYLHGFSASPLETSPLTENLANSLKANTYWARYTGHGISGTEGLRGVKLETWQEETRQALNIGRQIGDEIVVIAMSTAAPIVIHEILKDPSKIKSLILLSPNFGLPRWDSELLLFPGGAWLAKKIVGEYREWQPKNQGQAENWTTKYPAEILVEMMRAVQLSRKDDYKNLNIPTLGIYCENDTVIDPAKIPDKLNSVENTKLVKLHCEEDTHVFAGKILSPQTTDKVYQIILPQINRVIKPGNSPQ